MSPPPFTSFLKRSVLGCYYVLALCTFGNRYHLLLQGAGNLLVYFNAYLFIYLFILRERERERERDRMQVGEEQRERETESEAGSRLRAVSPEPDARLELTNCEIMT